MAKQSAKAIEKGLAEIESPLDLEGIKAELARLQRGQDELHKRMTEVQVTLRRYTELGAGQDNRSVLAGLESKVKEIAIRQQRMSHEQQCRDQRDAAKASEPAAIVATNGE